MDSPINIFLHNPMCPGDEVLLTGVVRDLHAAFSGKYRTGIGGCALQLWNNNPLVAKEVTRENARSIDIGFDISRSNDEPGHLLNLFATDLSRKLEIPGIPIRQFRGDIYLSDAERKRPDAMVPEGKYWIVMGGSKGDCQTKQWPTENYQEIVDMFHGSIQFVQCGTLGGNHIQYQLRGVTDRVGQTSVRQFIQMIHWAEGILCPITFAMHLAAAVPVREGAPPRRPCVVLAGGREQPHVFGYPGHAICHRAGMLMCNAQGSCWKSDVVPRGDAGARCVDVVKLGTPSRAYARCQSLISTAEVARAIWSYYDAGVLVP